MTTESKTLWQTDHPKRQELLRLSFAVSLAVLAALGLLGGAWVGRSEGSRMAGSISPHSAFTHAQTQTPTPTFKGLSDFPPDAQNVSSTSNSSVSSGTPSQIYINFDVLPSGAPVQPGTAITNQYPPAVFSSDASHYPVADNQFWNNSGPNLLGRAPISGFYDGTGYAPLYVNFTSPVNDLKFYMIAVDEYRRGVAQVNIFQNNRLTATKQIDGFGVAIIPLLVNIGAWGFNNVTRIEIVNINDYKGVG